MFFFGENIVSEPQRTL